MNKLNTLFTALLFTLPMVLFAEVATAPAQNTVTTAKQATINELLNVINFDKVINESIDASMKGLEQMLPGLAKHQTELRNFYNKTINPQQLRNDVTTIYAEIFTEQELKDLITFYKTPTGQKALQKLPEIMQRSMQLAQQRLMENQAELYTLMEKVAKEQAPQEAPQGVPQGVPQEAVK